MMSEPDWKTMCHALEGRTAENTHLQRKLAKMGTKLGRLRKSRTELIGSMEALSAANDGLLRENETLVAAVAAADKSGNIRMTAGGFSLRCRCGAYETGIFLPYGSTRIEMKCESCGNTEIIEGERCAD